MSGPSYPDSLIVLDRVLHLPDRGCAVLGEKLSTHTLDRLFPELKLNGVAQMVDVFYPVALVQANGNQVDAPVGVGAAVPL